MTRRLLLFALAALPVAAQSVGPYHIVFLRPAPDRKELPKEEADRLQAAHMANIHAMAERGVLVAAGPFDDTPRAVSGVFVMKAPSLAEALRIAAQDPTVAAHRNSIDGVTWTGPDGVGDEYRRRHAADPKTPEDMGVHPFVLLRRAPATSDAERLLRDGKLIAHGPLSSGGEFRYLYIFARIPDEEAWRLTPATLGPEFHRWWCAAHVF